MRGEHLPRTCCNRFAWGSSPHARGARADDEAELVQDGIIPACAGSTSARFRQAATWRDHPRMRGEHSSASRSVRNIVGSSPHARGAQRLRSLTMVDDGIIPACAGSTGDCFPPSYPQRDHPRMRGEHLEPFPGAEYGWGSSPHARGAQAKYDAENTRQGIIPACAGSTASRSDGTGTRRDHPRMRGEHSMPRNVQRSSWGSSPHARGALCAVNDGVTGDEDHPRMRGEHT